LGQRRLEAAGRHVAARTSRPAEPLSWASVSSWSALGAGAAAGLLLPAGLCSAEPAPQDVGRLEHATAKKYRFLHNLEGHRVAILPPGTTEYAAGYVRSFITPLAGTDIDAVMFCPTMWRTNMFPSEVDPWWKTYTPGQITRKNRNFDYLMKYLYEGGDAVRETLEACREINVGFFISYRMNDWHNLEDKDYPTHNPFWRAHPEYWLGDSDRPALGGPDNRRLFNWLVPAVREHYFAILEELADKYDIDGIEFDFQRCWRLFHDADIQTGAPLLTAFIRRVREMLDAIGRKRGRRLQLGVRSLHSVPQCRRFGIDIADWDRQSLLDMINVSSCYLHSTEVEIEEFLQTTPNSRIYGEMNYITNMEASKGSPKSSRRFTLPEHYRAAALNYLARGAHGISLFNLDFAPLAVRKAALSAFVGITDASRLPAQSKAYGIYFNNGTKNTSLPRADEARVPLIIGDDPSEQLMQRALLRLETLEKCAEATIKVRLNGTGLQECDNPDTELFPYLSEGVRRPETSLPPRDELKFYNVPLELLRYGRNDIELKKIAPAEQTITFYSLELALYAKSSDVSPDEKVVLPG
jgi:hypothetical protein